MNKKLFPVLFVLLGTPIFNGSLNVLVHIPIILFVYISFLFFFLKQKALFLSKRELIFISLFILNLSFSFFMAFYKYAAFIEFNYIFSYILFYCLLKLTIQNEKDIKKIVFCLIIGATSISIFGLFQYFDWLPKPWWGKSIFLSGTFVEHSHFAGFLNMIIPLNLACLFLRKKNKKIFLLFLSALIVLISSLFFSMSRGGWGSYLIGMSFFYLLYAKRYKILFITVGMTILIGSVYLAYKKTPSTNCSHRIEAGISFIRGSEQEFVRPLIWGKTLKMIQDNPFGIGLGQFVWEFPRYQDESLDFRIVYADNDYLHYIVELGMPFLILICCLVFEIIKKIKQILATQNVPIFLMGLVSSIMTMLGHSFVDYNLHVPSNAYAFTLLLFLVIHYPIIKIEWRDEESY